MSKLVTFACRCGQVQAKIDAVSPKTATRLTCSCKYCRAFARHLGAEGRIVEAPGSVTLMQVQPWRITLEQGADKLACLKLTPKGPLRWYASCCNTPLCSTTSRPGVPFLTLMTPNITSDPKDLPPVTYHAFTSALPVEGRPKGGTLADLRFIFGVLRRILAGFPRRYRQNPFFDEKGHPISAPHLLGRDEVSKSF